MSHFNLYRIVRTFDQWHPIDRFWRFDQASSFLVFGFFQAQDLCSYPFDLSIEEYSNIENMKLTHFIQLKNGKEFMLIGDLEGQNGVDK